MQFVEEQGIIISSFKKCSQKYGMFGTDFKGFSFRC